MKFLNKSILFLFMVGALAACEKDGFLPLSDVRPAVALNVSNATEYRPGPTVVVSRASPSFSIILEIPASSGRTIKEITRVIATTGSSQPLYGTTGLYNTAPIAGSGTKATFSTSLTEYTTKTATAVPANNPPLNNIELTRQFYFLVTLDNNEQLVSQQVRVLVVP